MKTQTIDVTVGQLIKKLRLDRGFSHEFVAFRLRKWGLNWSRSQLAMVEAGRRGLTVGEWIMLPAILTEALSISSPLTYEDLVPTAQRLALTPQLTVLNSDVVRELLLNQGHLEQGKFGAGRPIEDLFERPITSQKPYQEDAAWNAARHFHVPMEAISKAAEQLWRHPLSVERDRRILESGQSGRTLQALRGHVTRQLFRELAPQLITLGYLKKKGGKKKSKAAE